MTYKRIVIIESPFKGDYERNTRYLNACIRDVILRGGLPYASHKMVPGALDDTVGSERDLGIEVGLETAWSLVRDCGARVEFYLDCGMSAGMHRAWDFWNERCGIPFVRYLGPDWES